MKFLRDKCNIAREGVSLKDISRVADEIGLRSLPIKMSLNDLVGKIQLPCVIHWHYSHFVVVYKIRKDVFFLSDPQVGLVKYKRSEFDEFWRGRQEKGVVLVLEPSPQLYQQDDVKVSRNIYRYVDYIRPYKNFIGQVLIGMLTGIAVSLVFPFITQSIVDIGIETKDFDFINVLLIATLVLTLSSIISNYIQSRIILYVADRVNISMVSDFLRKLLQLPVTFFDRKMTSDILNRIRDHDRIQGFIMSAFLGIIVSTLSFIVYAAILSYYDIKLFFLFLGGTFLYVIWIFLFLGARRRLDLRLFDANTVNQNDIIQIIDSSTEIKINNLHQKKRWDWEKSRVEISNLSLKLLNLSQTQQFGTTVIDRVKNVLITFFAAKSVVAGEMTIGMMLSAQYIIGQMNGPVGQIIGLVQSYQDANISLERVNEVVEEEKEETIHTGVESAIPLNRTIKITDLSFKYHESTPLVLKKINLEIEEGKMTALVGQSGSGKTTLMKLLLRLYENYEGDILIGDTALTSINLDNWRQKCGAVLQDGKIFNDTILLNIVLEPDDVDQERLRSVIDIANLREFISETTLKLYTPIGNGGFGISGGQKQRILIARALYKDPDFLFFDEATNSLDAKNEREITNNFERVLKGKTSVIIAHRLSTVKSADKIVVLDKGEIVEVGNHSELLAMKGYYFNLVSNQIELDS
ncbi:ATP-binding cassette subfamily B protein [Dyadobacter arcticus]|uniref:ATP-binding cassette subfamily B protein n=2 Tax=Dyadobacter arcticus TaxID=1078754 RepID=A0ABX0UPN0_9BACT|nr:ATP-binding cassette subfamily B protein [Dyadobacter arcticus]